MNREDYNEYQRVYQIKRYHKRRETAVQLLGGRCVRCGSTRNLQLDHVNPGDKSFNPGRVWSTDEKFLNELKKCQLLCATCHIQKTVEERGQKMASGTHGTLSSYKYCKCDVCKKAMSDYNKEYRKRNAPIDQR